MGAETFPNIGSETATIEAPSSDPSAFTNCAVHEMESSVPLLDGVSEVDIATAANGSLSTDEPKDDQEIVKQEAMDVQAVDLSNGNGIHADIGAIAKGDSQEGDDSGWISVDGTPVVLPSASAAVPEQPWPSSRRRTFFLVRVPRAVDNKLRNETRLAELQLEETIKKRDFLRVALQMKRASKTELLEKLKPIREKERACRDAIQVKRTELEPFLAALARFKNAHSTVRGRGQDLCSSEEELNEKIADLQYRIQHESIPLKEEKQLVREIKQLEATRNQVCANTALQAELVENLGPREDIQDQYKLLCQDLDLMRTEHKQTRADYEVIDKQIEKLNAEIEELRQQFEKANSVQQEAYVAFKELRKQENAKNDMFYQNKRDVQAAKELASGRKFEDLEKFSLEQVESIFALWNTDSKFRSEYIKSNERSTLKRLQTLDGRSLGPDEDPPLLLSEFDGYTGAVSKSLDNRPLISSQETGNAKSSKVSKVEVKVPESAAHAINNENLNKIQLPLDAKKSEDTDKGAPTKPAVSNTVAGVSKPIPRNDLEDRLENAAQATELKERRRQEEMAKAKEAAERKKRQAERAESKALARAKKEVERKEKEKEKKALKKAAASAPQSAEKASSEVDTVLESEEVAVPTPKDVSKSSTNEIHRVPKPVQFRKPSGKRPKASRPASTNPFSKKTAWPIPIWAFVLLAVLVLLVILAVFFSL